MQRDDRCAYQLFPRHRLHARVIRVVPLAPVYLLQAPEVAAVLTVPQRPGQALDLVDGLPVARVPEAGAVPAVVGAVHDVLGPRARIAALEVRVVALGEGVLDGVPRGGAHVSHRVFLGLPGLLLPAEAAAHLGEHRVGAAVQAVVEAVEVSREPVHAHQRVCDVIPGDSLALVQVAPLVDERGELEEEHRQGALAAQALGVGEDGRLLQQVPRGARVAAPGVLLGPGDLKLRVLLVAIRAGQQCSLGALGVGQIARIAILQRRPVEVREPVEHELLAEHLLTGLACERFGRRDAEDRLLQRQLRPCAQHLPQRQGSCKRALSVAGADHQDILPGREAVGLVDGAKDVLARAGIDSARLAAVVEVQALDELVVVQIPDGDERPVSADAGFPRGLDGEFLAGAILDGGP